MNEEQEKMWKRLSTVPKPKIDWDAVSVHFVSAGRAFGKSTIAMQQLGRALRNETKDTE